MHYNLRNTGAAKARKGYRQRQGGPSAAPYMVLGGPYFLPWLVRGDQVFCRVRSGGTDFGGTNYRMTGQERLHGRYSRTITIPGTLYKIRGASEL